VSRVFLRRDGAAYRGIDDSIDVDPTPTQYADGHARALLEATPSDAEQTLLIVARYPGSAGNMRVRFTLRVGQNILSFDQQSQPRVGALSNRDVVLIRDLQSPLTSPPGEGEFYIANWNAETLDWDFTPASGADLHLSAFQQSDGIEIRVITLAITVTPTDGLGTPVTWDGIALDKAHTINGENDSLFERFRFHEEDPTRGAGLPIVVDQQNLDSGLDVLTAFLNASLASPAMSPPLDFALADPASTEDSRSLEVLLKGGNDGARPTANEYAGEAIPNTTRKTGLLQFEDVEDISIVAAPGSTFGFEGSYGVNGATILNQLISPCSTAATARRSPRSAPCARASTRSTPRSTTRGSRSSIR
jgi:hypothetical protein